MRVRRFAVAALLTLMAPALQAWPSNALPASASGPGITLLSTSQWVETIGSSTTRSYHLVGEIRNDAGVNVTGIHIRLNLYDSGGSPAGTTSTTSTVQVLAPAERSPFEAILFPPPTNYASFTVAQPITYATSVGTPDHQFNVSVDPCPNPNPASSDCQNHLTGTAQNPASAPSVNGVTAIFTFYDGSGAIVGQDLSPVLNSSGTTTLTPGSSGSFALDRPGEPAWATNAILVEPDYPVDINPAALNFGKQRLGTPSTTDVSVFNNGPDSVTIANAAGSGDFSVTSLSCTTIAPSSSCRVSVQFTPSAIGTRTGTLTVSHNAAGSPATIPLSGVGVAPAVSLNPTSLDFGSLAVGTTSQPRTVTLTNTGNDVLNIASVAASGDFSASQCPATINPGAYCRISVTFSPQSGGQRNGAVTITDDAAGSPHTVPLTGVGLGPGVAFTPARLDFGPVSMGSSSTQTVQLTNTGSAPLAITNISTSGDFQSPSDTCPRSPATLAASGVCTITVTFTPSAPGQRSASMVVTDNAGDSPQAYGLTGLGAQATYTAVITTQPSLPDSNGVDWQPVDPALTLTIKPPATETAILSGNADLWTATAGVNQDIGITVSVGGGSDTLLFWKESGGFAGTYSPNAAFVHGAYAMTAGFTYVFKLVWKANHPAPGASIFAGAGPIGTAFSPTRLTAQLVPGGVSNSVIRTQPQLTGNDGTSWRNVDPGLDLSFSGSLGTSAVITGNADLWTATAGINQDLGIFVTPPGQTQRLVAWKESGGSAGTYSPNAAFVQATFPTPSAGTYVVRLMWKINVNVPSASIFAGAGPINGRYSPTTLTVQLVNTSSAMSAVTTRQPTLGGNDGVIWEPLGPLAVTVPSSTSNAVAVVGANADLWTDTRGYNQDIGIFLSIDGAPGVLVGWKESGGFAGTFSPNAAFAQTVVPLPAGHSYTFTLMWKTNQAEGSATIAAGAGPIGSAYSPTSLRVQLSPN